MGGTRSDHTHTGSGTCTEDGLRTSGPYGGSVGVEGGDRLSFVSRVRHLLLVIGPVHCAGQVRGCHSRLVSGLIFDPGDHRSTKKGETDGRGAPTPDRDDRRRLGSTVESRRTPPTLPVRSPRSPVARTESGVDLPVDGVTPRGRDGTCITPRNLRNGGESRIGGRLEGS